MRWVYVTQSLNLHGFYRLEQEQLATHDLEIASVWALVVNRAFEWPPRTQFGIGKEQWNGLKIT